jgi:uncharacterized oxidoreductase
MGMAIVKRATGQKDSPQMSKVEEFIVVTGATRGIGAKLTKKLIGRGQNVIAVGRYLPALDKLKETYGDKVHVYSVDLGDPAACESFGVHIGESFQILGLINNAAIQVEGRLELQTWEEIDREIRTNLTAPAILSARVLPHLPKGRGFIANVTSGLGLAPKSDAAVYCATKAGLRNLTRGIENQQDPAQKIALIDVVLPLVDTEMTDGRGSGKISPELAAEAILSAIDKRLAVQWVGKAKLLGFVNRVSPALVARIMRRL